MMKSYKFSILSQSTWHALRNDLVSMLMPLFLMNHPNSMSVMHYAWNGQVSHFNNCKTINYLNNILFKKIHIILLSRFLIMRVITPVFFVSIPKKLESELKGSFFYTGFEYFAIICTYFSGTINDDKTVGCTFHVRLVCKI